MKNMEEGANGQGDGAGAGQLKQGSNDDSLSSLPLPPIAKANGLLSQDPSFQIPPPPPASDNIGFSAPWQGQQGKKGDPQQSHPQHQSQIDQSITSSGADSDDMNSVIDDIAQTVVIQEGEGLGASGEQQSLPAPRQSGSLASKESRVSSRESEEMEYNSFEFSHDPMADLVREVTEGGTGDRRQTIGIWGGGGGKSIRGSLLASTLTGGGGGKEGSEMVTPSPRRSSFATVSTIIMGRSMRQQEVGGPEDGGGGGGGGFFNMSTRAAAEAAISSTGAADVPSGADGSDVISEPRTPSPTRLTTEETAAAAAAVVHHPPPPPPPQGGRRESLRSLAPLIRRYSQEIKGSPWAVTLSSTRTKEKKYIDVAVTKFNQKPVAGIEYLVSNGIIRRTPEDVANFIRQKGGELSKRRVGEFVGSFDPFGQEVLNKLLQEYDFAGLSLDDAMRVLIKDIRFPGESQQIDRILQRFASRYYECNRTTYATEDVVYILSFSIMMLNTDLHNRNLNAREKMKLEDFIKNNRGINNGQDLPRDLQVTLYYSIKRHELRMKEGDMYESDLLTFMAPRISGWLNKKSQGTFGLWKKHWFVLTGGCLYYFHAPQDHDPRCIILLESVTAARGSSDPDIVLYSNFGTIIKSVKIRSDKTMVQGDHTRFLLRAPSREERDEWFEALQRESIEPPTLHSKTGGKGGPQTYRSPRGSVPSDSTYKALAQGWLRRRSDVSRSWQRRYFVLISAEKKKEKRIGLYYFTTKEMGQRMIELGVSTEQGMVPMHDVTAFRIKTPVDVITYRPPDPSATVLEIECVGIKELISPEDEIALQYWLDALRLYIYVNSSSSIGSGNSSGQLITSTNPTRTSSAL